MAEQPSGESAADPGGTRFPAVSRVAAVTVTYGDRGHLLERVIRALIREGCRLVVVVDNGSDSPLQDRTLDGGAMVRVVPMPRNMGSAAGYRAGLERALAEGARFIWLLDDDNEPQAGALAALTRAYDRFPGTQQRDGLALLSFRPDHQPDIAAGVPLKRCYPRASSFFGFHVVDVPHKLWRRTPWGRPRAAAAPLPCAIAVPHAPYSGLFFHSSLVQRIGMPNPEFVLYADDTEFTSRVTRNGGRIYLIPASRIVDLEASWNTKSRFASTLVGWLDGGSDMRAYYGARNQAYIETHPSQPGGAYVINKAVYLALLFTRALCTGRLRRLRLLMSAIREGTSGRLGAHPGFPLP